MKIDWKQKLSSRKMWFGIVLVIIGGIMNAVGYTTEGSSIITIGAGLSVGAEALVDIARIIGNAITELPKEEE